MPRITAVRPAAAVVGVVVVAITMALVMPRISAQTVPAPVGDILEDAGVIEGLSPLDPVLNPVSEALLTISNAIADGLAETPLVNTLALQGADPVEASIALSQATFPDGADTAILSREDVFADGFSSGAFQGRFSAPLIYTGSDDLDSRAGMELQRLGMQSVTILGGESALDPLVVQKLEIAGLEVLRVGGPTRVETAVEAARVTTPDATTAVIARAYPDPGEDDAQAYADLLAAGPYAAENGWPLLLTTSDELHPAVAEYLQEGIQQVIIVGGTSAVSEAVESTIASAGMDVQRLAGPNRFATAVEIARARGFTTSADAETLVIAESGGRPDVWAPGFAATAFAHRQQAPVLLTSGAAIPPETLNFLAQGVPENLLDGGPLVVCIPYVDPLACTGVGALMTANLALLEELLGIDLAEIPGIADIIAALQEQDLLPDDLQGALDAVVEGTGTGTATLTDVISAIVSGDPAAVEEALGGGGGGTEEPSPSPSPSEEGPTGTPLDDILPEA